MTTAHRPGTTYLKTHRITLGCGGECNQGRSACDCELSSDIAPDANRRIPAPLVEVGEGWILVVLVMLGAALAAGVWLGMS